MRLGRIEAVLTGKAVAYTRPGSASAIAKRRRAGVVRVGPLGMDGDEQGDPRLHGGPDKAVHLYAFEHYARWREELGALPVLGEPGAFGENLSTVGVGEADICLGDELRIGSVRLQVSQGRQPCWKLNDRFGLPDMARRLQDSLRTGWYGRVLDAGRLAAGDVMELLARPHPAWPLRRLMDMLYHRAADDAALADMLTLPLVPSWRRIVERRLSSGQIEDWRGRTEGPARGA